MSETRRWGKAGVRLSDEEARRRSLRVAAQRQSENARTARDLDTAYQLWRAGEFRPHIATFAMDRFNLAGPEVDEACGAAEPDVDLWEAGKRYPTWEQLLKLAALTKITPVFLVRGDEPIPWWETTMRFHCSPDRERVPPVRRCEPDAVAAVVAGTPQRRPTHAHA